MQGTILQAFQWYMEGDGQLWPHLTHEAQTIKELGFTSVWLPPAYKGTYGGHSIGYEPYDLYDLGEFDQKNSIKTKYGSRDEYLQCVKALKDAGLRVMVDIVMNHKAGGDETEKVKVVKVNVDNRMKVISKPIEVEAYTKFTFPGRQGKYSDFIWDFQCFTGVDSIVGSNEYGIYRILNGYEKDGLWQEVIGDEKGNFDYLMFNDVEFRNPHVREELLRWGKWYYDLLQFDSVRIDAVKHMPPQFVNEWVAEIRQHAGKEIFAVAEYWAPGFLSLLEQYIEATGGSVSLFDPSLQANFHHASQQGAMYDMRRIFDETLVSRHPDLTVTVVSNHDTQPLQALESVVESWFKPLAYALILLRVDGYPSVFYPDLYGAHYKDTGADGQEYEIWMEKVDKLEQIIHARNHHAFGDQNDYFDHPNCIGFVRGGDEQRAGCAIVMSNSDDGFKEMEIGQRYAGQMFADLLGNFPEPVQVGPDGRAIFNCRGGSVSVWIPAEALPEQYRASS